MLNGWNFSIKYLKIKALLLLLFVSLLVLSCAPRAVQPPPVLLPKKPVKVALVLGAGAARGFAHVGVIKVLEANHIPISMIVGTSVGSFVGSLYAYGYSAYDLQKIANSITKDDIADITLPDNGFLKGERLESFVDRMVHNTPIEKLKIPFYAVATDIQSGKEVVFGKGDTGMAVRASCSIPGVFRPAVINGRMYVDGGVVSPVAVQEARRYGADIVIAVDISADMDDARPTGTLDTMLKSVDIMYSKISYAQLAKADVVIRPRVGYIGSSDFSRKYDAMLEGERAAQAALPAIRQKLEQFRKEGRI
ncbi:MAG: patatin-like phospholipase family protein [Nitrospiraceae bacterium]|nr:patatin-like phospholipase family protein [Nitrospiraceae bacterium]